MSRDFIFRSPDLSHMYSFFFFNDTATTEIYTLSLHDALPISQLCNRRASMRGALQQVGDQMSIPLGRSEEHTSELQSRSDLVCRLLLEKKKYKDRRLAAYQLPLELRYHSRPDASSARL